MAISEYSSLVAAIKTWCARSDSVFNAQIDNIILMGEERLYSGFGRPGEPLYSPALRTKVMETSETITLTDGVGTIPDDFLAARKLYRSGDENGITFMPPERFATINAASGSGVPVYYTVEGSTLKIVPASSADELTLSYYQRPPHLTTAAPDNVNAVLLEHSMIYLEACLVAAFTFIQAADQVMAHAGICRSFIQGANATAAALKYAGPLRVRHRQPIP